MARRERRSPTPDALSAEDFGRSVAEFFAASGWGTLEFTAGQNRVATIDSTDWAESVAADGSQFSGCFFTTGVLVDFFSRITDAQVSVMETECRSMGGARCHFLIGTPEKLQAIYDQMASQ